MNSINEEIIKLQESINDIICYIPLLNYCEGKFEDAVSIEDIKFWGLCYFLRLARYNVISKSEKEYLVYLYILYLITKEISVNSIFNEIKTTLDAKEVELNNEIQNSSASKRRNNKKEGGSCI
jgi:hypothetical protein